jgi:hypothetical protein
MPAAGDVLREVLRDVGINCNAGKVEIHVRAYHMIDSNSYESSYMLCFSETDKTKICYRTKNKIAYTLALKNIRRSFRYAEKGDIELAGKMLKKWIRYFINRADMIFRERRSAPDTISIEVLRTAI